MNFEYGLKDDSDDDGGDGEREEGGFECGLNDDRSDSVGLIIMVRVKEIVKMMQIIVKEGVFSMG